MTGLQVAPCPRCKSPIVYGERGCRRCGQPFDYGASPPPEPSPEQVAQVIAALRAQYAAQQQAQQAPQHPQPQQARPSASPGSGAADFVDTGRFDAVSARDVEPEEIPGFVDSTLFAAYTPKDVRVAPVEGLEQTARADVGEVLVQRAAEVVPTQAAPVGDVSTEDIPGFVDSSLFARFTPAHVASAPVEGLEVGPGAATRRPNKARARGKDVPADDEEMDEVRCHSCGSKSKVYRCRSCGEARRLD